MKLYTPKKQRGYWLYDSNKYGYNYEILPYPEIKNDLKVLLTELINSKMFLPRRLEGRADELEFGDLDELINIIAKDNYLGNCFEFDIKGDTIIYAEQGEECYSDIFTISQFRTFQQNFSLSTKSDIWLPMAFDEDSYSFIWNLERYKLNYDRLPLVLHRIQKLLNWQNDNSKVIDYNERGGVQVGYDLFLNEEIIKMEYAINPNPDFNIEEYLLKIRNAMSTIQKNTI